jgi:chromosome segregation protein
LAQGQRLVSASGGLWRWDGVTVKPGAATAAAIRLEQRNRLAEARKELRRDQALLGQAQDTFAKIQAALAQASETERQARRASRTAESELNAARDRHATLIRHWTERASRLEALDDSTGQVAADMAEAEAALDEAEAARQGLADPAGLQSELAGQRQAVDEARSTLIGAKSQLEHIRQSEAERRQRLQSIAQDKARWQGRAASADGQITQLQDRQANAEREAAGLAEKPADIAERRRALLSKLSTVEADQRAAADALQVAETALHDAEEAAKLALAALQAAREDKVRLEGQVDLCRQRLADVVERTMETLQCRPEEVSEAAGIDPDGDLPDLEKVDLKLERLRRERDNMGPVNLRADIEATEVREKVETLASEREDLEAAIARLRQGIASLNREGRERLLAAFKQVDQHFQTLFVRVFGGGRAHLALTESEDPLEAGLEIMASPPGKRLQVMSLLSGGEQALTALALLFAVFLTRPAPICILDEVDAPLDDANVDRLCNLLDEIRATSNTRFLVVTHNPITMARMDRLFGVTMAERGVSQLVSVDLGQAEALRESA